MESRYLFRSDKDPGFWIRCGWIGKGYGVIGFKGNRVLICYGLGNWKYGVFSRFGFNGEIGGLGNDSVSFFVRLGNIVVILKLVLNLGPTDSVWIISRSLENVIEELEVSVIKIFLKYNLINIIDAVWDFRICLIIKSRPVESIVFIEICAKRVNTSQNICVLTVFLALSLGFFLSLIHFVFTMSQGNWITKSGGKKVEVAKHGLRITVPRFDNSELIASYSKTLIGRCMNPQKQDMKILLFLLPRIWNVEGRVAGVGLGLGRFQFNFDLEEDIVEVLKMEPFHFDYWMLSMVMWKLVLEPNYPSKITFWVRVMDIPLQFRAAPIFQSVGEALGQVQGQVDFVGGRVSVELDGFSMRSLLGKNTLGAGSKSMVQISGVCGGFR
ncbi:uncharacterized protein LOC106375074 [Brassica napus]|uniref:uncharacterized protein LOC106375074 n=1 Tax=Brassica napus TaxID=3708 RepID=UPI002078DE96|nr:uncharacterized protein LOC106375074 [Brassica napus]